MTVSRAPPVGITRARFLQSAGAVCLAAEPIGLGVRSVGTCLTPGAWPTRRRVDAVLHRVRGQAGASVSGNRNAFQRGLEQDEVIALSINYPKE